MDLRIGSSMSLRTGVWAHLLLYFGSFALDPAQLRGQLDQVANAQAQAPPGVVPANLLSTEYDDSTEAQLPQSVEPANAPSTEATPPEMAPLSMPHTASLQNLGTKVEAVSAAYQEPANPVLQLYVQETKQYEKDAVEAEKAAKMYAKMNEELVKQGALKASTQALTNQEMSRVGAKLWAHSVYVFEKMLTDNTGSIGAAAAAKGGVPYQKVVNAYVKQQGVYDVAAQGYALRVGEILPVSKKLMTYANQYRLQGNDKMADDYDNQATSLMAQADAFAGQSKANYKMATELNLAVPGIQKMVGIAGTFAAFNAMKGAPWPIPQSHLFPFTPVPPLEFVQVGSHVKEATGKAGAGDMVIPPPTPPKNFLHR